MDTAPARVIVLAAQRAGVVDPLAAACGITHKCLVPIGGRPLIEHVLRTVAAHPAVGSLMISIERQSFDALADRLPRDLPGRAAIANVPAADNLADSVIAAAHGHEGPILITTADNVLLAPASIDAMLAGLAGHDAAIAMARREAVLAAHPDGQRRFYGFRDGDYSNCNLYGLASAEALRAAEVFRGGGQFAKKASRIVNAFGLVNLLLLRSRLIGLHDATRRISRRLGLDLVPVILTDGSQAIDVDNERTFRVVSDILSARRSLPAAA
ncbi:MAG TPA: NTP transferase domain-containing protein [Novosphingobium sp.]|nr:NTP transferase domain-containing protein [Novosphingobium sp.]